MCSYAIRKLNCIAGVMVTASHNPQAYNGYKAYWKEGQPVRLLGVGISSFTDETQSKPVQTSLFDQFEDTFDVAASVSHL